MLFVTQEIIWKIYLKITMYKSILSLHEYLIGQNRKMQKWVNISIPPPPKKKKMSAKN